MRIIIIGLTIAAGVGIAPTLAALPDVPLPNTEVLPYDPGSGPTDRNVPFLAWHEDLSADGYREQEVLLSGTANTYEYVDEAAQLPDAQVATSGHSYTTRMLLRHPADPADFNGVVYMEILNATANYDGAPMWNFTYPSIMADGAAWVGVTYSDTTARFMRNTWGEDRAPAPAGAQPRNRSRYAGLNVRSRAYTWDILSQAAALLKADTAAGNPMQGYAVDTIIVTGYSQSARYVTTYANSFYPHYAAGSAEPVVDGYIVAAGGPVASTLDGRGFHRTPGDPRNLNISGGYTVRYTTESDVDSALVRLTQQQNPMLRTYEAAGTSHVDLQGDLTGNDVALYQFGVSGGDWACDLPLNPIRTGVPLSAVQHRLARWIQHGAPPPDDRFIDYDPDSGEWLRDSDGNVTGGVRTARIDIPLGSYSGSNPYSGDDIIAGILCNGIIGSFAAFDDAEIVDRYNNKLLFVLRTWGALWRQWFDGFLLPVDAPVILNEARELELDGLPDRPQRPRAPRRGRGGVR